jgi:hypothetical protein
MTDTAGSEPLEFRHDALVKIGLAVFVGLFAAMAMMFVAFSAGLFADGFWGTGIAFIGATALTIQLARITLREFFFRLRWRVRLDTDAAQLDLPASRLLFGSEPALTGTLPYSDIEAVEWREEAVRSFGLAAINRVYAIRLKSGGVVLLGEDRPVGKQGQYMTLAGTAARALAKQASVKLQELPMAEGAGGFLTLFGISRPAWSQRGEAPTLSAADERAIRRSLLLTQLLPVIAFAALIGAHLLG